jgi:S1-C subfamily serine protease
VPAEQSRVGDVALVVGRSPNSGPNVSMGIISALSGPWRTWRGGQLDQYLRLDATVFPGSSGGAVIDYRGRVLGIATSALSRIAGLAIPASTVNRVVDFLLERGSVPHGYLGVSLQPVRLPESLLAQTPARRPVALIVYGVEPAGPAEKAGILIGDILLEIDSVGTGSIEDLQAALNWDRIGKSLPVKIIRGGKLKELAVVVGQRASGEPK